VTQAAGALVDAGPVSDFEDGVPRVVTLAGLEFGVVRWDSGFYAFRNLCPHQLAAIGRGKARARLLSTGPLAGVERDGSRPVIVCPRHRWEFDLHSGRALFDESGPRLRMLPVTVAGDRVMVEVEGRR